MGEEDGRGEGNGEEVARYSRLKEKSRRGKKRKRKERSVHKIKWEEEGEVILANKVYAEGLWSG